jgi:hypothetical protein
MKDIFVDNNVAKSFANPMTQEYKDLVAWLMHDGALVVSNKLLAEYFRSSGHAASSTSIAVIVNHLVSNGRLNKISNKQLSEFKFRKHVERSLRSNRLDWPHLMTVLLSIRRLAITIDQGLSYDINNYPGVGATAVQCPSEIDYREASEDQSVNS